MRDTLDTANLDIDGLFDKLREAPDSLVFVPLADACRKLDRADEGLEICDKGLERHPSYASGHVVRGKCLYDLGRHDDAQDAFETVLRFDAHNLVAHKYLGMMEAMAGRYDAARAHLKSILLLDPENPEILEALERVDDHSKRPSTVGQAEHEKTAQENVVEGEVGAGETSEADASEDVPPTVGAARERQEHNELKSGAHADAVTGEREASPEDSDELATITLADIYATQGYRDKALTIYREVLARQPDNHVVRGKIEALAVDPDASDEATGRGSSSAGDESTERSDTEDKATSEEPVATQTETPAEKASERAGNAKTMPKKKVDDRESMDRFRQWLQSMRD